MRPELLFVRAAPASASAGISARRACSSSGSSPSRPVHAGAPRASSQSTIPAANTSARASIGSPRACSGLMYPALPLMASSISCAASSARRRVVRVRDPEVAHLDFALERHEHVRRGHVAVNDAERPARRRPSGGARSRARCSVSLRMCTANSKGSGTFACEQRRSSSLRSKPSTYSIAMKSRSSRAPEVEHLHDVRVVQARRELRLVDEHLRELRVARELGEDLLDDARRDAPSSVCARAR